MGPWNLLYIGWESQNEKVGNLWYISCIGIRCVSSQVLILSKSNFYLISILLPAHTSIFEWQHYYLIWIMLEQMQLTELHHELALSQAEVNSVNHTLQEVRHRSRHETIEVREYLLWYTFCKFDIFNIYPEQRNRKKNETTALKYAQNFWTWQTLIF